MRFEIIIIAITAFFIYNTYHDGKLTKLFMKHKKYIQMGFFAFLGIMFYLIIKKSPEKFKNILLHANNVVKYMPIDKSSMDMISPIIDFTNVNVGYDDTDEGNFMGNLNKQEARIVRSGVQSGVQSGFQSGVHSGHHKATKRSVSETKKKYVASMQNWKCGECHNQLNAWFEVDHKKRLEHGGGNDVANLVALCRECHGRKTAHENM
jgi:hypothetical protein